MQDELINLNGVDYVRSYAEARILPCAFADMPPAIASASKEVVDKMWWQDKDNPDLVWAKIILDAEGANANWDYMPRPSLVKSYATAKYKPMDMDHIVKETNSMVGMDKNNPPVKNTIFGVMTHPALADSNGDPLDEKAIAALENSDDMNRDKEDRVTVICYAAMYNFLFPKTTKAVLAGAANGSMHVSMERWIKDFDFIISDGKEFKAVSRADGTKQGLDKKWARREFHNGHAVLRRSLNFLYGGVASTKNPASSVATYVEPPATKAVASESDFAVALEKLEARHSHLHQSYDVISDDAKVIALINEHTLIHRAIAALKELMTPAGV